MKKTTNRGGFFSLKLISIFICLMLIVGNVTATHSTNGINVPDFWTAAKDFWDFLRTPSEDDALIEADDENQDEQLVNLISDELSTSDDLENLGLSELMNNPICQSIYVADYLPTFNKEAIDKCNKLVEQEEIRELFNHYVVDLCQQTSTSNLSKQEITEIQLRLRKYSLTFPQANFQVELKDVDGIYGSKTCEYVAHYQIALQYNLINGQLDKLLYDQLSNTIPLTDTELNEISTIPAKSKSDRVIDELTEQYASTHHPKATLRVPRNPFKRLVFCMKHKKAPDCKPESRKMDVAKNEANQR